MKRMLLLIFALSLGLSAQTMVGLPQYGVGFEGTPQAPKIVNHSAKTIIGYAVQFHAQIAKKPGQGPAHSALLMYPRSAPIRPGASMISTAGAISSPVGSSPVLPVGPDQPSLMLQAEVPIIGATLDSVIFADGQLVGPDESGGGNFQSFEMMLNAYRTEGAAAVSMLDTDQTTAWRNILVLSKQPIKDQGDPLERVPRLVAGWLLRERADHGDAAAYDLAKYYRDLPKLWK